MHAWCACLKDLFVEALCRCHIGRSASQCTSQRDGFRRLSLWAPGASRASKKCHQCMMLGSSASRAGLRHSAAGEMMCPAFPGVWHRCRLHMCSAILQLLMGLTASCMGLVSDRSPGLCRCTNEVHTVTSILSGVLVGAVGAATLDLGDVSPFHT